MKKDTAGRWWGTWETGAGGSRSSRPTWSTERVILSKDGHIDAHQTHSPPVCPWESLKKRYSATFLPLNMGWPEGLTRTNRCWSKTFYRISTCSLPLSCSQHHAIWGSHRKAHKIPWSQLSLLWRKTWEWVRIQPLQVSQLLQGSQVRSQTLRQRKLSPLCPIFQLRRLCEHKISNVYLGVFFYITIVSPVHRVPTALGWVKEVSWPSALTQQGLSRLPFLSLA